MNDVIVHRQDPLATRLPPELAPLSRLAFNLWWSWQPGAGEVFREIDPGRWEASGKNPVKMLRDTSPDCLAVGGAERVARRARARARRRARSRSRATLRVAGRRDRRAPHRLLLRRVRAARVAADLLGRPRCARRRLAEGGVGLGACRWWPSACTTGAATSASDSIARAGSTSTGRSDRRGAPDATSRSTRRERRVSVHVEIRGHNVAACIWHVAGRSRAAVPARHQPARERSDQPLHHVDALRRRPSVSPHAVRDAGDRRRARAARAWGSIRRSSTSTRGTRRSRPSSSCARAAHAGWRSTRRSRLLAQRVVFTTHTPVAGGQRALRRLADRRGPRLAPVGARRGARPAPRARAPAPGARSVVASSASPSSRCARRARPTA